MDPQAYLPRTYKIPDRTFDAVRCGLPLVVEKVRVDVRGKRVAAVTEEFLRFAKGAAGRQQHRNY